MAKSGDRDRIWQRLGEAWEKAPQRDLRATDRMVVLSDQHKGSRDGADDFQRAERSYNAALAYYNHLGYHLVLLGDVEELWENEFDEVAADYPRALALEARFHRDDPPGRYIRIFGNHDIDWEDRGKFRKAMASHGVGDVEPLEALKLRVLDAGGGEVGTLFLVHGHQGTPDSDLHAGSSRFLVRRIWRAVQGRLDRPWNTPAVDWGLRGRHAQDMAAWAEKERRVMIAGHTHLPVFWNARNEPEVVPEPGPESGSERVEALRLARAEWADAERVRLAQEKRPHLNTPCYFNTGCCSFGDGDITGIEIGDGRIQLIRWACRPDAEPEVLGDPLELAFVFEKVGS